MNILFICKRFWPSVGGVERHVYEVGVRLAKRENKVTVLTEKYQPKLKNREDIEGVQVVRFIFPKKKIFGLLYIWLWIFKNRDLIKKSDLVHCHDVFVWYLPFRFLYPRKVVYTTFHGWEGIYPIPLKNIFLKRLSARLSRRNICVGEFIGKYYGVKADTITYGAVSTPLDESLKKDKKSIVYVGRLEEDTGLPILLAALTKLPNYKVVFCGDGKLRKTCENYGKVLGFVDPSPFVSRSYICFASGYLSILEALSNKCLVIVSHNNKLKEDYYNLTPFSKRIFKADDPSKIVQIVKGCRNPETTVEKRNRAYNWVKNENWEAVVQKYLRLWGK